MTIRLMTIKDYEKVYQLWISCEGMGLNNQDDSKVGIDTFLKRNPDSCFVAEDNSEIIGAIISGSDGRRGFIYHTAVYPEHRNRGIAEQLVEAVINALKSKGIKKVALVVFDRNEVGNDFWERVGFTARDDLVYRNKVISELTRIDT